VTYIYDVLTIYKVLSSADYDEPFLATCLMPEMAQTGFSFSIESDSQHTSSCMKSITILATSGSTLLAWFSFKLDMLKKRIKNDASRLSRLVPAGMRRAVFAGREGQPQEANRFGAELLLIRRAGGEANGTRYCCSCCPDCCCSGWQRCSWRHCCSSCRRV